MQFSAPISTYYKTTITLEFKMTNKKMIITQFLINRYNKIIYTNK